MPKSEQKLSGISRTSHKRQSNLKTEDDSDSNTDDGYVTPGEEDYALRDIPPAPTREQRANEMGRQGPHVLTVANRLLYWDPKTRHSDRILRWLFKFFRQFCHKIAPYAFDKNNVPYTEYRWIKLSTEVYLRTRSDPSVQFQNRSYTDVIDHPRHSSIKSERGILKQERSPDIQEVGEEAWRPGATSSILDCHDDLNRRISSCVESQVKAQVGSHLRTFAPLLQLSQLATQMSQLQNTRHTTSPESSRPYDSIIHGEEAGSKTRDSEEIDMSQIPEYPHDCPPAEPIVSQSTSAEAWQLVTRKKQKRKHKSFEPESPPSIASTPPPTEMPKKQKHRESTAAKDRTEDSPPTQKLRRSKSKEFKQRKLGQKKPTKSHAETVETHTPLSRMAEDNPRERQRSRWTVPECATTNSKGKEKIKRRSNGNQSDDLAIERHTSPFLPANPFRNADQGKSALYNLYKNGFHKYSIYVTYLRMNARRNTGLNTALGAWLADWFPKSDVKGHTLWDNTYYFMVNFDAPVALDRGIDLLERPPEVFRLGLAGGNEVEHIPYQADIPSHNPLLCRAPVKSIH